MSAPKKDAAGCVSAGSALLGLPFVIAIQVAVGAYTLRALWAWFVVPTFHVAPLALAAAAGLDLLVTFVVPSRAVSAKEAELAERSPAWSLAADLGRALVKAGFCLLIGWALHAWWPL